MRRINTGLVELKFATGEEGRKGVFSGYGAVFGNVDSYGDVLEKGAFTTSLRDWSAKGKLPPMLLQHGGFFGGVDDQLPIGRWTSMEENAKGLKVEGELFALGTQRGQYLYEGLASGELDGMSIGYAARNFTAGTKTGEPRRTLHEVDLIEVSVVTFPANDKARIGSVKAAGELPTLREFEEHLREMGFSNKQARHVAEHGLKSLRLRDEGRDDQATEAADALRGAVQGFTLPSF